MANELNEVGGPTNPKGNPVGNPNLNNAARGTFFGNDKRTESQFSPTTDLGKQNVGATKPYLPKLSKG